MAVSEVYGQKEWFVTAPINGKTAEGGSGVGDDTTHLQQIHAIRLHAVYSLTNSLFYDWPGDFRRSKYTPLCCANDIDRGCDIFDILDSSTLTTEKNEEAGEREGKMFGWKRP